MTSFVLAETQVQSDEPCRVRVSSLLCSDTIIYDQLIIHPPVMWVFRVYTQGAIGAGKGIVSFTYALIRDTRAFWGFIYET